MSHTFIAKLKLSDLNELYALNSSLKERNKALEKTLKSTTEQIRNKNEIQIEKNKKIISDQDDKIKKIRSGECDEEYEEKYKIIQENSVLKIKSIPKQTEQKQFKAHFNGIPPPSEQEIIISQTNAYFARLDKINNRFGKLLENLNSMPGNKGYILDGIWCMGHKDSQGDQIIMYERSMGIDYVHEYKNGEHIMYEKPKYENKKYNRRA